MTYPSFNGQGNRSNLFLTDGVNNLGAFDSGAAVPPIVDSIQEFKVQSHNDQAEFGMATGGTVNVVTKSGTNVYHGSAWEFLRNDVFDARNYFRPNVTPLRQNMFGGTLGGRIIRNKTFFFLGYQGYRKSTPANTLYRVPTPANLGGDFSDWPQQIYDPLTTRQDPARPGVMLRSPFAGKQIPVARFDQGVSGLPALYGAGADRYRCCGQESIERHAHAPEPGGIHCARRSYVWRQGFRMGAGERQLLPQ